MSDAARAEDNTGTEIPGEVESKAREMGWRPKEEWEGDDAGWMDYEPFIERQDKRRAVANEEFKTANQKLESELATLRAEQAETKQTIEDFKGWQTKAEERLYKKALNDVQAKQRQAVETGDTEAFDAAQIEADEIVKDAQAAPAQRPPSPDDIPAFKAWSKNNDWYGKDMKLTKEANQYGAEVGRIHGLTPDQPAFYDKITEQLKEDFPEKFENPNRQRPSAVEDNQGGKTKKGGKTFADLPSDAKSACDRFVKQKLFVDSAGAPLSDAKARDKYVADFFAEEE